MLRTRSAQRARAQRLFTVERRSPTAPRPPRPALFTVFSGADLSQRYAHARHGSLRAQLFRARPWHGAVQPRAHACLAPAERAFVHGIHTENLFSLFSLLQRGQQ